MKKRLKKEKMGVRERKRELAHDEDAIWGP